MIKKMCRKAFGTTFNHQVKMVHRVLGCKSRRTKKLTASITRIVCAVLFVVLTILDYIIEQTVTLFKNVGRLIDAAYEKSELLGATTITAIMASVMLSVILIGNVAHAIHVSTFNEYRIVSYEVKSGDTMWDLAGEYAEALNMSREDWINIAYKSTPYLEADYIKPGQYVNIAVPITTPKEVKYENISS